MCFSRLFTIMISFVFSAHVSDLIKKILELLGRKRYTRVGLKVPLKSAAVTCTVLS